jgi:hypothetical protein
MRRIHRFNMLSMFGDMAPKQYILALTVLSYHFSNPLNRAEIWGSEKLPKGSYMSDKIERFLKDIINDGLLELVDNEFIKQARLIRCGHEFHPAYDGKLCISNIISPRDYDLKITSKGRECLGAEQIARSGDYAFYKNFDGTIDSAKQINPGLF